MKKKRVLHPSKLCSTKVLHEIKLRSGFLSVMSTVVETSLNFIKCVFGYFFTKSTL